MFQFKIKIKIWVSSHELSISVSRLEVSHSEARYSFYLNYKYLVLPSWQCLQSRHTNNYSNINTFHSELSTGDGEYFKNLFHIIVSRRHEICLDWTSYMRTGKCVGVDASSPAFPAYLPGRDDDWGGWRHHGLTQSQSHSMLVPLTHW